MRRYFFWKLFGGFFAIIVLLTGLILVFSVTNVRRHYLDTLTDHLERLGRSLMPRIEMYLDQDSPQELDAYVKEMGRNLETRITVIDRDGRVLGDSDEDPKVMDDHTFRPEILAAFEGQPGSSQRFSRTLKARMLYVGLPIVREGSVSHVLRLSLYKQDFNILIGDIVTGIVRSVVIILLAAVAAALLLSRSITQPIRQISTVSRRMASGDFDAHITLKNRDEVGELATSFNFMSDRIRVLFDELNRQQEQLRSLIKAIGEGIVALDEEGRILFFNQGFANMIQEKDLQDKYIWEAVRKPEFVEFVREAQNEKRKYWKEIEFSGKAYRCSSVYLKESRETVITFHDITDIKRIENIKRDFVDNVTHELNTPLAAIKGFVETLEEGADDEQNSYLEIIKRNTERMINIVRDLLVLSELEEKDLTRHFEEVQLVQVVENALKIFKSVLDKKGLTVEFEKDEDLPIVLGDSFKLEQMFINLIDNAVKYTEKGKISISLRKEAEAVGFEIRDTGIGIPQDQISRIFERFYVVDKSRSKKLGGTGLGLSIVKHTVQLHGGSINVKSTVGEGSTFSIHFPRI